MQGHARSLKLLAEGRLKVQLDSDGHEEEEGETHAERFARTINTAQVSYSRFFIHTLHLLVWKMVSTF